ncbi:MAG TPA: ABC transporter ATP-binding protein [Acidimicrobiales bacterium]|nr:ABC transporter ATP-binding protein [Acidimicrobiales bacterium]
MAERTFRRDHRLTLEERVRPVLAMAAACFRADPLRASLSLLFRLTAAASGPVFAAAVARLIDAARPGRPLAAAVGSAVVLAGAVAARAVLDEIGWKVVQILEERTAHFVDLEVIALVGGLPGLEHLERPEHLDRIERIKEEQWLLAMSVEALVNTVVTFFAIGLTIAVLGSVDAWLLLLPVFALPSLAAGAKAERIRWRTLDERMADYRLSEDLMKLATETAPAKELRVFGLGPEIVRRHRQVVDRMERWERDHRLQGAYLISAGRAVFVLGYVGAIAIVADGVAKGTASRSDLVLTVVLAGQVMAQLNGATGTANWTAWTFTAVRRWLWLLDYAVGARRAVRVEGEVPLLPAPKGLRDGVRFEAVSFRYPGTEVDVLTDVDLHIPAGTTVAIVGDNGAGKTTLVKLLCRFYEPTTGRLTVDGIDLKAVDIEGWRASTGAVFQDHARLELPALEAVTIGDLARFRSVDAADAAMERAGSSDVLAALPEGWETQLGARWPGGVDLSGGQWQKLALGRGMMRDEAILFVFDEPTAALDAETEHRLFAEYAALSSRGRAERGTVTLLVSHRFSTVRMADVIVVVADGRITESGSHDELVRAGGTYAELYELQARAYR